MTIYSVVITVHGHLVDEELHIIEALDIVFDAVDSISRYNNVIRIRGLVTAQSDESMVQRVADRVWDANKSTYCPVSIQAYAMPSTPAIAANLTYSDYKTMNGEVTCRLEN